MEIPITISVVLVVFLVGFYKLMRRLMELDQEKRFIAGILIILVFVISPFNMTYGQKQYMSRQDYIEKYKDIAIKKMKEFGIPASITLSQGILESNNGNSKLARKANNHFGIKCHNEWRGKRFFMDDDKRNECFRKYKHPGESFDDHSLFLTSRDRYSFLFSLEITDYKAWARGLKKAGYATNPKYAPLLIKIIEENELYRYDVSEFETISIVKDSSQFISDNAEIAKDIVKPAEIKQCHDCQPGIYINNKVRFVFASQGDTPFSIAAKYGLYSFQIYKYNEFEEGVHLEEGEIVYLERKRRRNKTKYHIVQKNESLHDIAQRYAVRLKILRKRNHLQDDESILEGIRLILKGSNIARLQRLHEL